jgi:hypothetical protein
LIWIVGGVYAGIVFVRVHVCIYCRRTRSARTKVTPGEDRTGREETRRLCAYISLHRTPTFSVRLAGRKKRSSMVALALLLGSRVELDTME